MPQRERSIQISDLWRGESEQPPFNRHPGSVEESQNIRFDFNDGATKRAHSELIADISKTVSAGGLDATKRYLWISLRNYVIALGHGIVRAFDVTDGSSLEIDVDTTTEGGIPHDNGGDSGNTFAWTFDYIDTTDPLVVLSASVAFDTIVVASNAITITTTYTDSFQTSLDNIIDDIRADEDASAPDATAEFRGAVDSFDDLIQFIEPVKFRTTSNVDDSPSPPYDDWTAGDILEVLKAQSGNSYATPHRAVFDRFVMVEDDQKWYASLTDWFDDNGDVIRIKNSEYLEHPDSPQNQIRLATNHGQGKLIQRAKDGDVYRTKIDFASDPAGYYVFYIGNADQGQWYRIPPSNIGDSQGGSGIGASGQDERGSRDGKYVATTMPIRILIDESGSTPRISIGLIPYDQRLSGNVDTNKAAGFVGTTIEAIEFNQSRLFKLTADVVESSRENQFFNDWIDNVNNIVDGDRIEKDINARNVGKVLDTEVLGTTLFIRCENGQLEFHSGDQALTSVNGRVQQVGDFKDIGVPTNGNGISIALVDESLRVHQFRWGNMATGVQWMGIVNEHVPDHLGGLTVRGVHMAEQSTFIVTDRET